jgi:opacity protein-like surface antigen
MMRRLLLASLGFAGLLFTSAAAAEQGPADAGGKRGPREGFGVLAGAKVGGIIPFGGLGPNITGGIELGVVFPWVHRSFALAVDLDYAAPQASGSETDPRIMTGGKYTWHLTQQELNLMPVVMYRLTSLGMVTPFVGVGPRFYFLKSTVRSNEGEPTFQETTEQSTKVGFGVPLGVEIQLGPGGLLAELLFQYGALDHTATGVSNTGGASLAVGYRFLF